MILSYPLGLKKKVLAHKLPEWRQVFPVLMLFFIVLMLFTTVPSKAQLTQDDPFTDSDMALDLAEARTWQRYPTYAHYLQLMQGFAADYPDICRLDTFGTSPGGRLLLALKISDQVQENEAEAPFLYTSTMHGDEIVGYVLLLRLADTLLSGYGEDPEITTLVYELEIWINPLANPDGAYAADFDLSLKNASRYTLDGTDLNRDFPDPAVAEKDDISGRALETRYMMEFLRDKSFVLAANLHGGAEVVNYPWDHTFDLHADDDWYRFISHEYADEAIAVHPDYMFGWPEGGITNGAQWYVTQGSRQDYVNYYLGGREVTLELSNDKLLLSDQLESLWQINYRSLLNYMNQCRYGIRGRVSDLDTGDPLKAQLEILDYDSAYSLVHSRESKGDYYRLIKEGCYDLVFSAYGYFNDTIYDVSVQDYEATLLDVQLQAWLSGLNEKAAPELRIWPNPASEHIYLEARGLSHGPMMIQLYRLDGKRLLEVEREWSGSALQLSLHMLPPGIYLLRARSANEEVWKKFVLLGGKLR